MNAQEMIDEGGMSVMIVVMHPTERDWTMMTVDALGAPGVAVGVH